MFTGKQWDNTVWHVYNGLQWTIMHLTKETTIHTTAQTNHGHYGKCNKAVTKGQVCTTSHTHTEGLKCTYPLDT